ncbi:LysR family transcriptional regulator [Rhizobium sp. J15]|uniref:LysR family transcriptional regulator n=1 Tax=Rhizobium sp. J15 TaxID=2035450 RepID=UPI000BE9DED0|nr:LysR family transcriptional regulator [Rhizobium sp. J15]PDT18649.1 LysR family transcriptional regulator [Rhizobium sp. J15]
MNFSAIDLNLLRVFDVLMREGNVTIAAERLGRTQSAVSHSLGKLRALFNDKLFFRDGGSMKPTPRAIELSAEISDALANIRATIDRYQRFVPAQTRRVFRVGLLDYHGAMVIPHLIKRFRAEAPHAALNVIPTSKEEVGRLILTRKLDCATIVNFDRHDQNLLVSEVGRDELACAIWSGSELLRRPLTLERYLEAAHVQISADGSSEGLADKVLRDMGFQRNVVATIPNYMVIPWVLRGSDLIIHCADSVLSLLDETSEVSMVKAPLTLPSMPISLIIHWQMATDPATIWFKGLIEEIYADRQIRKDAAGGKSPGEESRQ